MRNLLSFIILILIVFPGCKKSDSPTQPTPNNSDGFSVEISVNDQNGNAVPNLRVLGGNKIDITMGLYENFWATSVYKAKFIAKDTNKTTVLFQDSIYLVVSEIDVQQNTCYLGSTNSAGLLKVTDMKRFPQLLNVPRMKRTSETGPEVLGEFNVLDSAYFILQDTITKKYQRFDCVITKGQNQFKIKWAPLSATPSSFMPAYPNNNMCNPSLAAHGNLFKLFNWQLYQNYPNPFNISTSIQFDLQANCFASIVLYDLLGNEKKVLLNQVLNAGAYSISGIRL